MFDVGFSELIVIGLVALIVIGPQRLPTVARTVGHLLGRLQRYVNDVKSDISREMQLEELKKLQEQVASQARDMEKQVNEQMSSVESDLNASIAKGIEEKAEQEAAATETTVAPALPGPLEEPPLTAAPVTAAAPAAPDKPHA
jgi:sec-independent protein translocase protein TatB